MQEENLKSRAEEKEIAMVVEDVIVMIKDLKKISDDKALLNTAMLELNRFLNNFNYKLNSEQKFLLQKMTS